MNKWVSNIYFLKIALMFLVISFVLLLLVSCKFTELVFYEHGASKEFYKNYDINEPELKPFKSSGVLFTVSMKAVNNRTEYIVWQGLASQEENRSVKIEKAIIHGDGWEQLSVLEQEVFMNTVFGKDDLLKGLVSERYFDHDLLFLGNVQLFRIKGDLLEKVYRDGGNIGIKVFYEIDGEEGVMNYELKRRVEKKNVYPT